MRSTQNPHLVDLQGVVAVSRDVVPAPCLSPLKAGFASEVQRVAEALNRLRPGAIEVLPFDSLSGFASILVDLAQNGQPFTLTVPGSGH